MTSTSSRSNSASVGSRSRDSSHPAIPDNTSVLVIATPEVDYLPREVEIVSAYLKRGGNLLWLTDPGPLHGLDGLAAELGLKLSPGTLVDPATAIFGIDHPAIVPVTSYPSTAPVAGFRYLTVFPYAREVKAEARDEWRAAPLLSSGADAWIETGKLEGELRYDEGSDHHGPLDIALRLTRNRTAAADAPKQGPESTPNTDEKAQKSERPPPEQRVSWCSGMATSCRTAISATVATWTSGSRPSTGWQATRP
jgi:gliding motility-associatede transport system auxiliary component